MLLIGLLLLYKGGDFLVDGATSLAKKMGISTLVIGLTVVAFGTSMPELIVNVYAALSSNSGVTFGNVLGSNIANLLLILGASALLVPLYVQKSTAWKEIPLSFLAALTLAIMSNDVFLSGESQNLLSRGDGLMLLIFFSLFLYYVRDMIKETKKEPNTPEAHNHSTFAISGMIGIGLAMLFFGGKFTVDSAVNIARSMGISELLISTTIIAVGTSLPEIITSVIAAFKKEADLAVGNIVGSNIFNIFFIMGLSAVIAPLNVPIGVNMDFAFLIAATALTFAFLFIGKKYELKKWNGAVFLAFYAVYIALSIARG
jgi:cation:H+ antiporter